MIFMTYEQNLNAAMLLAAYTLCKKTLNLPELCIDLKSRVQI